MAVGKEVTIRLDLNTEKLLRGAKDAKQSLKSIGETPIDNKTLRALGWELRDLNKDAVQLRQKLIDATQLPRGAGRDDQLTALKKQLGEVADQAANVGKVMDDIRKKSLLGRAGAFGEKMAPIGSALTMGVTAPIMAGGAAIVGSVLKMGALAQELDHLHESTGLSYDNLQKLRNVSLVLGTDFEGVTLQVQMLQRKLMGIEQDGGLAAKAFHRLGIDVDDASGHLRPMNELFPELLAKLQAMPSITERNALASQLFGRTFAAIAPMLGLTASKMDEYANSGYKMTEQQIKEGIEFDRTWNQLKMTLGQVFVKIGADLLPLLRDEVVPLIKNTAIPAIKSLADTAKGLLGQFMALPKPIRDTAVAITAIAAAAGPAISGISNILIGAAGLKFLMPGGIAAGIKGAATGTAGLIGAAGLATEGADWLLGTVTGAGGKRLGNGGSMLNLSMGRAIGMGIDALGARGEAAGKLKAWGPITSEPTGRRLAQFRRGTPADMAITSSMAAIMPDTNDLAMMKQANLQIDVRIAKAKALGDTIKIMSLEEERGLLKISMAKATYNAKIAEAARKHQDEAVAKMKAEMPDYGGQAAALKESATIAIEAKRKDILDKRAADEAKRQELITQAADAEGAARIEGLAQWLKHSGKSYEADVMMARDALAKKLDMLDKEHRKTGMPVEERKRAAQMDYYASVKDLTDKRDADTKAETDKKLADDKEAALKLADQRQSEMAAGRQGMELRLEGIGRSRLSGQLKILNAYEDEKIGLQKLADTGENVQERWTLAGLRYSADMQAAKMQGVGEFSSARDLWTQTQTLAARYGGRMETDPVKIAVDQKGLLEKILAALQVGFGTANAHAATGLARALPKGI